MFLFSGDSVPAYGLQKLFVNSHCSDSLLKFKFHEVE